MYKQQSRGHGKLPPLHAEIAPWNEVCIDHTSPWEIVVNGNICVFKALTCIDPVTNLTELIRTQNRTMGLKMYGYQDIQDQTDPSMIMAESLLVGNS